jgi:hypothetical protein
VRRGLPDSLFPLFLGWQNLTSFGGERARESKNRPFTFELWLSKPLLSSILREATKQNHLNIVGAEETAEIESLCPENEERSLVRE